MAVAPRKIFDRLEMSDKTYPVSKRTGRPIPTEDEKVIPRPKAKPKGWQARDIFSGQFKAK